MGMRDVFNILESLGGQATQSQIRTKAKEIGYPPSNITYDLHTLSSWHIVKSSNLKPDQSIDQRVWTIIGTREWNVIYL